MDSVHIRRFAAAAVLLAATASHAFAQVTLVAEPASLTFNVTGGTPATQDLLIRTSNNTAAQVTLPPQPTGISWTIVSAPNGTTFTPITLRVAATAGAVSTSLTFSGSGLSPIQVPITVTGGGGSGGAAFSATPSSLQFNQTGTIPPLGQTIFISSNTGIVPMYSVAISPGTTPWLTTSPAHATTSSSPTLTVTPVSSALGTGTYNANIILTPQNVAALPITIPVFLSVNQAGTTQLTVSPSPIVFTYPAGTTTAQSQNVQVSSSPAVAFTAALSANLASFAQVTPPSATTPSQLTVSIVFPQAVPAGTSGTLTLTPTAGSGFGITAIPIQINAGGGTVGSFIVNPSTLTFNGIVGATTTVPAQNVTVASADGTQQFFQATATSTNNFLFVSTGTNATPATVSVGVNMASITTPGTYTGTITFSPFTGGLPTTIQVTLNATSSITVTPTPASVTVTAGTGTAAVQQNVSLTSTTADVPFTTSATTTSGGQWLSVTTANTTLPGTITISANPANLALGTYNGTVTVMSQNATVATIPVTFTVTTASTMTVAPATLTFAHQTTSTTPPPAQAVQITTSGAAITWNATATSTGGWLQVSPATGTTPGTLNVSVNPTGLAPGAYTGTVNVSSSSATNSPQTINVTLNVATPAIPQISSVVNAASNAPTSAAPGLIATIFGSDLGPTPPVSAQVNPQGLIDTTLGGLRVLFDGVPAPVLYASPTQVNFVVPYEIAGRFSTRMQVEARNQRSREIELRVAETAPGVFTISGTGAGQGAVLNQNGTVNGAANPEQRGNVIVIYATGHGQTNPIGTNGRVLPGSDLRRPAAPIVVRIGGRIAEVTYAGSAPGMVSGALQVNARVPMDAPTGANVVVEVQAGVNISQANVTVALQ